MFHIKTDIRQYKCETAEKVERLIRNWVIRPSDLIYNSTEKTWNPIGQHPAFDDIFAGIEQEEANEPDTIVTEAPSEVAAEHEVEPGTELESDGPGAEETTNVRPAPSGASGAERTNGASADAVATPSIVIDADSATLAADSEEITNVTEAPEEPAAPEDEITDVREDPRRDTDEQDAADAPAPSPPEPSEDVEGLIRDSDEITMMTDKTFEMLSEESGKKASKPGDDADGAPADVVSDDSAADRSASSEQDQSDSDEAGEVQDEDAESSEDELDEESEPDQVEPDQGEQEKSSGGGRHGLPEEVFATDEIPRQDVQQAVLDELGELEEDADPVEEDDEVTELIDRDADDADEGDERKSRWRIVMSDDIDGDEKVDEAPGEDGRADGGPVEDELAEDEPAEDETAEDETAEDKPVEDKPADEPDDADDLDVDPQDDTAEVEARDQDASLEEDEALSVEVPEEDDDLDDMLDEAAELVGLGEESNPVDIDGGALEPLGDDEGEDDAGRQRADTPVRAVAEPKEFISEGYNLPLPVDISPSTEDIRLGLKHSRMPRALKDATFPYPKPKKRDEVSTRRFDLDPEDPADHSMLIVAGFVIGLLIIVLGAVTVFG
jgi:hypothetical protein